MSGKWRPDVATPNRRRENLTGLCMFEPQRGGTPPVAP